jgi:hypothetical protein
LKSGFQRVENYSWSNSEKRIARQVFDQAVANELAELIADFKRAAAVNSPDGKKTTYFIDDQVKSSDAQNCNWLSLSD